MPEIPVTMTRKNQARCPRLGGMAVSMPAPQNCFSTQCQLGRAGHWSMLTPLEGAKVE
jgi:hypothetical protein